MTWIKENKFLVALGGGTLVAVIALFVVGSQGKTRYDAALEEFSAAASEASGFERLSLYPRDENRDGKTKALDEYRSAVTSLQEAFGPFRPEEIQNVSPQDFTSKLIAVNDEVVKAFNDAGTTFPEPFFLGFEAYKTSLARGESTGILGYQLGKIRSLMLALAGAGASELKNLHRPTLPEEDGRKFEPGPNAVFRSLPLEITFMGTEKSVREFISQIVKTDEKFTVIRSLRISNAKQDPPRAADAKFDKPAAAAPAGGSVFGGAFDGGFVLPGEEPAGDAADAPAVEETPETAPAPDPGPSDSSRILSQVLGNEEVQVFLRLDILQFLPAKKLP